MYPLKPFYMHAMHPYFFAAILSTCLISENSHSAEKNNTIDTLPTSAIKNLSDQDILNALKKLPPKEKKTPKNTQLYQRAKSGDAKAQRAYAHALENEKNSPDLEQAFYWYSKSAEQGNAEAMLDVAYFYRNGLGTEADIEKALEFYIKGAESGEPKGYGWLGDIYRGGLGVDVDLEKAAYFYEKGTEAKHPFSMEHFARALIEGAGVDKDIDAGIQLMEEAANLDNSAAMVSTGYHYLTGEGIEADYDKSMYWFRKAANNDNLLGIYNLGYNYITDEHGKLPQKVKGAAYIIYAEQKGGSVAKQYLEEDLSKLSKSQVRRAYKLAKEIDSTKNYEFY